MGEGGDCPRCCRSLMHECEHPPDLGIPRSRQPPSLSCWQKRHVASQRFYEQRLAKSRQHSLSTGTACLRVCDGISDRILQPASRLVLANVHLEHRWQSRQEHLTQAPLAGHETAYKPRNLTSTAHSREFQSLREYPLQLTFAVHSIETRPALHTMRIAVRENNNVSGKNFEALIAELGVCFALDQQVVADHVPGGLIDIGRQLGRIRRMKAPRRRKLCVVKKRAIQLYGLQHL